MEGVIDVEMRNAEMRRILSQDPNVSKALAKIEEDQRKAGLDSKQRSIYVPQLEQPPKSSLSSKSESNATKEA